MRLVALSVVLLVAGAGRVSAQGPPVDQGVFAITRAGAGSGAESFLITRQVGSDGPSYALTSTRTLSGRQIQDKLRTDSLGAPVAYSRTISGDSSARMGIAGRTVGRLTVNETRPGIHSSKDYLLKGNTLLLDDDLVSQLYLVTMNDAPRVISWLSPGTGSTGSGSLEALGDEEVTLGNRVTVTARHFAFGSGDARREIWIDSNKRLLKVAIPSRQIEAIRTDLPK